ncbi:hypothetical protein HDU87_002301 [Geranomyces variabilis]|uniref:Receptor ligand binding region domain-containing protein n=1 Tax=Geranomyces variabilis TaxID=109894 RepID=A0AAD5XTD8_9FUNG|nr:hypothetical protein HDU87_002301 [Geranomyces variabilis]
MAIKLAETRTLQTIPEDSAQGNVLSSVVQAYERTSIGMIYAGSAYAKGIADQFASDLPSGGALKIIFNGQYDMDSYQETLNALRASDSRIIVWAGDPSDLVTCVPYACKIGLFGLMYSWVCPETALGVPDTIASAIAQGLAIQADADALNGLLMTSPVEGSGALYDNLQAQYRSTYGESIQHMNPSPLAQHRQILLLETSREISPLNSTMQANTVGVCGKLIFDQNFDRIGAYELVNVYGVSRTAGTTVDTNYKLVLTANATFFSGTNAIPSSDIVQTENDTEADQWVRRMRSSGTLRGESSGGSKSVGISSGGGNVPVRSNREDGEKEPPSRVPLKSYREEAGDD